jgi:hypothetical protein
VVDHGWVLSRAAVRPRGRCGAEAAV